MRLFVLLQTVGFDAISRRREFEEARPEQGGGLPQKGQRCGVVPLPEVRGGRGVQDRDDGPRQLGESFEQERRLVEVRLPEGRRHRDLERALPEPPGCPSRGRGVLPLDRQLGAECGLLATHGGDRHDQDAHGRDAGPRRPPGAQRGRLPGDCQLGPGRRRQEKDQRVEWFSGDAAVAEAPRVQPRVLGDAVGHEADGGGPEHHGQLPRQRPVVQREDHAREPGQRRLRRLVRPRRHGPKGPRAPHPAQGQGRHDRGVRGRLAVEAERQTHRGRDDVEI
mmetsp:Transcript_66771/g.204340  ORF Transcript_66771/g.204340 Transcript_66771/m.204340 type:complete len:279 (+) Transcript_66771:830-1666(+)